MLRKCCLTEFVGQKNKPKFQRGALLSTDMQENMWAWLRDSRPEGDLSVIVCFCNGDFYRKEG